MSGFPRDADDDPSYRSALPYYWRDDDPRIDDDPLALLADDMTEEES